MHFSLDDGLCCGHGVAQAQVIEHCVADGLVVLIHGLERVYKLDIFLLFFFVDEGALQAFFLHSLVALELLEHLHWVLPVEQQQL